MVPRSGLIIVVAASLAGATGTGAAQASPGEFEKMGYGKTPDGQAVTLYTLRNGKTVAKISTRGAVVTELHVLDRTGKSGDVVLGFDSLQGYLSPNPYFGAVVGRVANRIARGKFT